MVRKSLLDKKDRCMTVAIVQRAYLKDGFVVVIVTVQNVERRFGCARVVRQKAKGCSVTTALLQYVDRQP